MTTNKPRINVTFEEVTAGFLVHLAQQENKSVSSLVRELTMEALDRREDMYLSKLADNLDQPNSKLYTHEESWR